MKNRLKRAALFALVVLSFLIVSFMDYEDEKTQAEYCAEMVKARAWPAGACE